MAQPGMTELLSLAAQKSRNFFIRHLYNPHRNGERIAHPECRKILTLLNTS